MADAGQGDDSGRIIANIRKLSNESQWETWKWQIELCLKEQCLFTIVDGTRPCPDGPAADAEPSDAYRRWQRDNARAARILGTSLDEEASIYVRKKTNAKNIWDTLISVFEQSSLQRLYTLFDSFFAITKDDTTSVSKHVSQLSNVFDDILNELAKGSPNATLPLSLLHHRIFKTLGPEYQYYRSTWYRVPEAEQTTKLLIENLRSIESSSVSQESWQSSGAFFAKSKLHQGSKKKQNKSNQDSSSTNTKEKRSCLYCKKKGHVIKDCRKRASAEQNKEEQNKIINANSNKQDTKQNNPPSSFFATGLAVNIDFVPADSWISDSGTTHHISANKQHFVTFDKFPTPQRIQTAGKDFILAYGSGKISVDVRMGDRWSSAELTDVWYVPEARHQLFSVRQAAAYGNDVIFNRDGVEIRRDGELVATGELVDSVYVMNIRVRVPDVPVQANLATSADVLQAWHERFGHQDKRHVREVLSRFDISIKCSDAATFCDGCVLGKSHRKPFRTRLDRPNVVGELINADVNGPMTIESINGFRFYVAFKDDFSQFVRVFFMKHKSEVTEHLKTFLNECETAGHKVKAFRSDCGTEFECQGVLKLLCERGIEFRPSCPYTPEQNGVAEQSNRHVVELARSMLTVSGLSKSFWAHACDTATFLINRTGKSRVPGKTPFELWTGRKFDSFDHLRIFGSECYVNMPKQFRSKFDPKAILGHFVGYVNDKDGYKVWVPSKHRIVKSRDVDFRPEKLCTTNKTVDLEFKTHHDNQAYQDDDDDIDHGDSDDERESTSDFQDADDMPDSDKDESISAEEPALVQAPPRRPARTIRPPVRLGDYQVGHRTRRFEANVALTCSTEAVHDDLEPTNFNEAMKSRHSDKWVRAMNDEMDALKENDTWNLVKLPPGKRAIDNRWVLRVKHKSDGSVDRYRARLVVRGIFQRAGLDYDETFSPVARYDSIRAFIAIAAEEKFALGQFDVRTAFLYGKIDAEIYMTQPQGFDDGTGRVCRLKKSLYGLKQSPRCWNNKFHSFMRKSGFLRSTADPCIYVRLKEGEKLMVAIYVDDGLIAGSSQTTVDSFLELLTSEFKITVGSLDSFLGMQIERHDSGFFLSQRAYVERILQRFDMIDCKSVKTPAESQQPDSSSNAALESPNQYRSVVGSLLYLACATRPDIAYAVSRVARSMTNPNASDWAHVKRILRYLRGTSGLGLLYTSTTDRLRGYSDADFAGDVNTRRSTNGFVTVLNGTAVSWTSQLQKSVALSTTEAEFVAASEGAKELVWLTRLLSEIGDREETPTLFIDNASAIKLVKNPEFHKRSKHIAVRYYFVRERYQEGDIDVEHVRSEDQLGDMFTKPLNSVKFKSLCSKIGLCE